MSQDLAPDQAVQHAPGTCPAFHAGIELIGKRWTGVVLQALRESPQRFSELREQVPRITDAMLAQRLKELEAAGVVERAVAMTRPVEVRYQLTAIGHRLAPVLDAVAAWSQDWVQQGQTATNGSTSRAD